MRKVSPFFIVVCICLLTACSVQQETSMAGPSTIQITTAKEYETAISSTPEYYETLEAYARVYREADIPLYVPAELPEGAQFTGVNVRPGRYVTLLYSVPQGNDRSVYAMYANELADPAIAIPEFVKSEPQLFQEIEYNGKTVYYATDTAAPANAVGESGPSYYILYEWEGQYLTASIPADALRDGKKHRLSIEDALQYLATERLEIPR